MRRFVAALVAGKRVNRKAVLILAGGLVGLLVAVHFVHAFQMARNADGLLEQADQVERDGQPERAIVLLKEYLGLRRSDADVQARYGLLLGRLAKHPRVRVSAFLALEQALRLNGQRKDVRREAARQACAIGRFRDAKIHLDILVKGDKAEDADLMHLCGRCEAGLRNDDKAAKWYQQAAEKAPEQVEISLEYAGLLRERLQEPGAADEVILEMVERGGKSPELRLQAARYFAHFGNTKAALEQARKALDKAEEKKERPAEDLLLLASDLAAAEGELKEAQQILDRGRQLYPKDERMGQGLARLELHKGEPAKALKLLEPTVHSLPKDPDRLWSLGNLLLDARAPDRVGEIIQRLKADRENPQAGPLAVLLEGQLALHKEAWARAAQLLEEVQADGRLPRRLAGRANVLLAQCYERLGNPDRALEAYRRAVAKDPSSVPARRGVASTLAVTGKLDQAIAEHRKLAAEQPKARPELARLLIARNLRRPAAERNWSEVKKLLSDPSEGKPTLEAGLLQAEVMVAEGLAAEARKKAEALCKIYPKQPSPWLFLARLDERENGVRAALERVDQAEQAAGQKAEWVLARAGIWLRAGGPEVGERLTQLAAKLSQFSKEERGRLLMALGEAHAAAGDLKAARQLWGKLAERDPDNVSVRVLLLEAALSANDEKEAPRLLRDLTRLAGERAAVTAYGQAALYLWQAQRGDKQKALAAARPYLERAAALRPSWAKVAVLQGVACELAGDSDKALKHYQAALERGEGRLNVVRRVVQLLSAQRHYAEADALLRKLPERALGMSDLGRLAVQVKVLQAEGQPEPEAARRAALDLARKAVAADSKDHRDYLWLGQLAALADQREEAERALRRACALAPREPETWAALVLFLARTDPKRVEAEVAVVRAKLRSDKVPPVLGPAYEALGQLARAEAEYLKPMEARPKNPQVLQAVAAFYLRTGQLAKAEPHLRVLLSVEAPAETLAWARRGLAVALAFQGGFERFQQAQDLLARSPTKDVVEDGRARALVLGTHPGHRQQAIALFEELTPRAGAAADEMRFLLAQLYEADGRWAKAQAELLGLLRTGQNNPVYLARYVRGLLRNKRADDAQPWVEKLAAAAPQAPETLDLQVQFLKARGQKDDAAALVQTYAGRAEARLEVAAILLEQLGRMAEAEKLYRAHAAKAPQPEAILLLAVHLARQQRVSEALEICAAAWAKCRPETVGAATLTVLRTGNPTASHRASVERLLKDLLQKRPQVKQLGNFLAGLYELEARWEEAIAAYRAALKRDERNVIALNNLAFLLAARGGDAAEALRLAERAIELAGPVAALLDTRGVIHLKKGQTEQAVKDLQQALQQAPSPGRYLHLALAHDRGRNRTAAARALRQATDAGLRPDSVHPLEREEFNRLARDLPLGADR